MSKFPIFEERLRLNDFKKGELPFFIRHHEMKHYPMHHHEFAEIALVTQGSGTVTVNGTEYRLRPGSVGFMLPYSLHALKVDDGVPSRKYCCMFDIQLLFQFEEMEVGRWLITLADRLPPFYELPPERYVAVRSVMDTLQAEYDGSNPGKQGFMHIKLLEFIHHFFRFHPDFGSLELRNEGKPNEWDYVKYVHAHYAKEGISLEEVARHFGVSVFAIRNAFKRLLGKNFLEYLHLLRVRRASGLLAATEMTVSEIAYDVGFDSLRTFTRVFKELTGMSATEFRKQQARMRDNRADDTNPG